MYNQPFVTTRHGQRYTFRLRSTQILPESLNPERFWDNNLALQFIRSLNVPEGRWRHLANASIGSGYSGWRRSNPWSPVEEYIAQSLTRGDFQVFKVEDNTQLKHTTAKRRFKNQYGVTYRFMPAASLLSGKPDSLKTIRSKTDAQTFLKSIGASSEQKQELAKSLDLPLNSTQLTDDKALDDALCNALVTNAVVVTAQEAPLKPPVEAGAAAEPAPAPDMSSPPPAARPVAATPASGSGAGSTSAAANEAGIQNEAAQADTLAQAAEEGSPFCEECEKKKEKTA